MGEQIRTNTYISGKVNDNVVEWEKGRMWLVSEDLKMIDSKPSQSILLTENQHMITTLVTNHLAILTW